VITQREVEKQQDERTAHNALVLAYFAGSLEYRLALQDHGPKEQDAALNKLEEHYKLVDLMMGSTLKGPAQEMRGVLGRGYFAGNDKTVEGFNDLYAALENRKR